MTRMIKSAAGAHDGLKTTHRFAFRNLGAGRIGPGPGSRHTHLLAMPVEIVNHCRRLTAGKGGRSLRQRVDRAGENQELRWPQ